MDSVTQQEVKRRLKSAEGHIRGIVRMLDDEQPCVALIQQLQAVQGSLKQTQMLLLQKHLQICLCDLDQQNADQIQRLRQELVLLFERSH
ncbi:MAG: metal-sensitive transcriptional regulator [Caldilineaceae bacterium]|nr:metal-sensitive transcriptional regulator [Caldilineaceae bacterium]